MDEVMGPYPEKVQGWRRCALEARFICSGKTKMNKNSGHIIPEKTPLDYPTAQYFLVALLGAIGAGVSAPKEFLSKWENVTNAQSQVAIVSMVTSGFCGVLMPPVYESLEIKLL